MPRPKLCEYGCGELYTPTRNGVLAGKGHRACWDAKARVSPLRTALIEPSGGFAADAVALPRIEHPKGWEPHVEESGNVATAISQPTTEANPDEPKLIAGWGLDPNLWRIVGPLNCRRWQTNVPTKVDGKTVGYEQVWLYYYKANLERIDPVRESDTAALIAEIRTHKPTKRRLVGDGAPDAFVVALADPQMGKSDGDGVDGTAQRILVAIDSVESRVKELRRIGRPLETLYLLGMGDLIEGCFAGETEVVTRTGTRQIRDLAHDGRAVIKTEYGGWVDAAVRSFGVQPLFKIELSRGNSRKTLFATKEHRWFRLGDPSRNSGKVEVLTDGLATGDMLVSNFGKHPESLSPVGVMAGYVYGDGHRNSDDLQHGCSVGVHRDDFDMLKFFSGHPCGSLSHGHESDTMRVTEMSDFVKVSGLPAFFKKLPDLDESLPFLYGWAAGYFAADGNVGKCVSVSSADRGALEHLASVCARVGIGTNPITVSRRFGTGTVKTELFRMSLIASTLDPDFFVLPRKRARFEQLRASVSGRGAYTFQKNRARNWRVESVVDSGRVEEVYCAVVPDTRSFTLANDILTGNCDGHYDMQTFTVQLNRRYQVKVMRQLVLKALQQWAPLFERIVVAAVGGNHGENRKGGKAYTDFADNDDVAIFEQVGEIMAAHPAAYGHVSFKIPDDKLTLTLDVAGTIAGMTHGQVFGKGGGVPAQKAVKWWADQAHGQQAVGSASLLFSGHYHHLLVTESGSKTHFQCPALEGGSDWFSNTTGQVARKGMLTLRVGKDVSASGWSDLEVV